MFLLSLSFLTSLNLRRNRFTLKLQAAQNILMNTIKVQALLYNYPNPKTASLKKIDPDPDPRRDETTGFLAKWRLRNERRNSILMTCHYLDLGSASDWLKQIFLAAWPIRCSTQIGGVTCHQYVISALVSQMSFRGETIDGAIKRRLFSAQANFICICNFSTGAGKLQWSESSWFAMDYSLLWL